MPKCPKQPTKESTKDELLKYLKYQMVNVEKTREKLIKYCNRLENAQKIYDELYDKK